MSECTECGTKIGFFAGFSAASCEQCGNVYCGKCKGSKIEACQECRGNYCSKCLSKEEHECVEADSEDDAEEESDESKTDETEEEDSEEEEPIKVDLKEAEENETLIFSEDRNWVYFNRSSPDTWEEVFQYLGKLNEQGYELYTGQEDNFIFRKKV